MTQPVEWGDVSQLDWIPTLKTILNADNDVDVSPERITTPPWLTFDLSFTGTVEDRNAKPWEHWMPLDPEHVGWNAVTIYRKIWPDSRRGYFQLLRGRFDFYEPAGNFEVSPARQAEHFVTLSASVVDTIRTSPVLDATGFTQASETLDRIVTWLKDTGQPRLTALMNDADPDNFSGTAAEVFLWALEDLRYGMGDLQSIIQEPTSWITVLSDAATAINTFKTAMENAWSTFKSYRYYNPNWMVAEVVHSFEQQMDALDARIGWGWSAARNTLREWWFDFSAIEGLGRYNLVQQDEWARLSDDMKKTWTANHDTLENTVRAATQALIAALVPVWTALGRGVRPLQTLPPPQSMTPGPGGDDPPGGGPDLDDLNQAGGSGPNLDDLNQIGGNGPDLSDLNQTGNNGPDLSDLNQTGNNGPDLTGLNQVGGNGPNLNDLLGGNGPNLAGGPGGLTLGGSLPNLNNASGSAIGGLPGPGQSSAGFSGPGLSTVGGGTSTGGLPPVTGGLIGGSTRTPAMGSAGGSVPDLPGRTVGGAGSRSNAGGIIGPMGATPPGYEGPTGSLEEVMRAAGVDVPGATGAGAGGSAGVATAGGSIGGGALGAAGGAGALGAAGGSTGSLTGPMAGSATGPGAAGAAGSGTVAGGYPFMPPMMGGMGGGRGENERERERTTWLAEDAEVWGTDPACSPSVIGAEEETEATPVTAPTAWPQGPGHQYRPAQGTRPARGA